MYSSSRMNEFNPSELARFFQVAGGRDASTQTDPPLKFDASTQTTRAQKNYNRLSTDQIMKVVSMYYKENKRIDQIAQETGHSSRSVLYFVEKYAPNFGTDHGGTRYNPIVISNDD